MFVHSSLHWEDFAYLQCGAWVVWALVQNIVMSVCVSAGSGEV